VRRGIVRFALRALVVVSFATLVSPAAHGESQPGTKAPRADPTRLWSEFPLYPSGLPRPAKPAASAAQTTRALTPNAFGAPHSSRLLFLLLLGVPLGVSVLLLAIAGAPPWALPELLLNFVDDRRSDLAFGGVVTALAVGLGIAVALFFS
jgi:hypothetical protein